MNLQLFLIATLLITAASADRHVIDIRSPDLTPVGLTYDPTAQHFIVASTRHRKIVSVSDAGVVEPLISDPDLPPDSSFPALAVHGQRLLAAVNAPSLSALAAYDLRSKDRIFLSPLSENPPLTPNSVAVDTAGNAYVTSAAANLIWKVTRDGVTTVFSNSTAFDSSEPAGLSGIAYVSKGYFLVTQRETGRLFKVGERDGVARRVPMDRELLGAGEVALRRDGALAVASPGKVWAVRSGDSFGEGYVAAEVEVEGATSLVAVKGRGVYALLGKTVEEIEWVKEDARDELVWIYVLVGFGFVYFMVWRFQMKKLISNMDKKIN